MTRLYDCCGHCTHDISDPPHEIPCPDGCAEDSVDSPGPGMITFMGGGFTAFLGARLDEDEADAPNQPDPDRALREVAAKRARLGLAFSATIKMDELAADSMASDAERAVAVGCSAVAIVAVNHDGSVYSGHPDYRREWSA